MKIGSNDNHKPVAPTPTPTAAPPREAAEAQAGKVATAAVPSEASAQVALSPAAALLVGDNGADFDAQKVARIAQAIRDGKFEVNAGAIADKLIANAQELLSGPAH